METELSNKQIGDAGENIAVSFLKTHGYVILEQNWRYGQAEADIICRTQHELIFVEVKTRGTDKYGYPEQAVTKQKQRQYMRLAEGYIQKHKMSIDIRFDIISIVNKSPEPEVFHIKDAFFPYNL